MRRKSSCRRCCPRPSANGSTVRSPTPRASSDAIAAGIEVGYSDRVSSGFRVGARDGGYYVSFSDTDFDALLREYLREKVFRMLFEA